MSTEVHKEYHPMWEKPQHHETARVKTNHVHWIELFYDLIHVVCIFLLGNLLSNNLNPEGFLLFSSIFILIWMSWGDYSYYNSLYISTDYKHRLLSAFHIITVMLMAASIPSIADGGFTYFIAAYIGNRFMMGLFYLRAIRYNNTSCKLASKMSLNFLLMALICLGVLFVPPYYGIIIISIVVVFSQLCYIIPKLGVMELPNFTPRLPHITERFSLLLLICLGEGFFKMVLGLGEKGIASASWDIYFNYIFGGLILFLLAWMYFDFAGKWTIKDTNKYTMMRWWYSHMILMLSAVMIGVSLTGTVKVHYYDPYPLKYAIIGCTGLSLYLLSLWSIESTVKRWNGSLVSFGKIRFSGIIIALLTLFGVIIGVPSIIGISMYFSAIAIQLLLPILRGYRMIFHEKSF